jgi:AGCS family alanine or glycine:cation symporter
MESLNQLLASINSFVWGPPLLVLLMGTGVYLTLLLRGVQFRYIWYSTKQAFSAPDPQSTAPGDISQFQALMTSLAGALGTGTVVGVATAVAVGGLGALFWMWVTAFLGMALKYSESLLAVKYRKIDDRGEMMGGPMQYMEDGLGWKWIAMIFAFFGAFAAIGTGNLLQSNAITSAIVSMWDADSLWTAIILAVVVGLVLIGGVKSIGKVAGILVPIMAFFYIAAGLVIIALHIDRLPEVIYTIFASAFSGQAAFGGFAGSSILIAMQMGVARGIISTEAGLGISSMAAAAAKTDCPARQAMITMTGALISTVIVCSITGFVLGIAGVQGKTDQFGAQLNGTAMAIEAFSSTITGGGYIVAVGLILFAFTTVIAWGYYGEKCCEYLLGERSVLFYRFLFTLLVIPGAIMKLETVWYLADILNAFMVLPNLIALIALSSVIVAETNLFLKLIKDSKSSKDPIELALSK